MSTLIGNLPIAVAPSATDELVINQGSPRKTARIPLAQIQPVTFSINVQGGVSYAPIASDGMNSIIEMTNASANTVVIPSASTLNFVVGSVIILLQYGLGQSSFSAASGAVIRNSSSANCRAQYSMIAAIKIGLNEWVVVGDFA